MKLKKSYDSLPKTNWGLEITTDLKSCPDTVVRKIARMATESLVVLFRNQKLEPVDESRLCQLMGETEKMPSEIHFRCPSDVNGNVLVDIQRVTGAKDPQGKPKGLFYHNEVLDWHANRASFIEGRKPLVWLHSVEGSKESRTSWINLELAYAEMGVDLKKRLEGLKAFYGYKPGAYTPVVDFKEHVNPTPFPLVRENRINSRKGIYFPFNQMFGIEGLEEQEFSDLMSEIKRHVLNEKYTYHHDWQDGDVIISEQWLTIHKRWPCNVSERTLHRITMSYPEL